MAPGAAVLPWHFPPAPSPRAERAFARLDAGQQQKHMTTSGGFLFCPVFGIFASELTFNPSATGHALFARKTAQRLLSASTGGIQAVVLKSIS